MFIFNGQEFASHIEGIEEEKDTLLIALEYHNQVIKEIKEACHGYYDITFEDGMKLDAISYKHIYRLD